jgi:phage gp29-like protein
MRAMFIKNHFKNMGLFSNIFKETPKALPPAMSDEMGDTGTTIYNGYISGEEYNADLTGVGKYTVYDKMRKGDATVAASLKVLKLPLRAANWYVEPAGEDDLQKVQAKFIEYNLMSAMSIPWDDFLRQSLLMLEYGVFVFEKVFDYVEFEGKTYIGWKKFAPRHPRTISQWTTNKGDGITQQKTGGESVEIPIEKLIIFINEREGDNWEGISILRSAYKNWFFKDIFEQIDAMAFERQGLGVPYCKVPNGASAQDKENAKTLVKNLRANEKAYVVYPDGYEVGFLDMGAAKTRDPKNSIEYHNRQIVLNILAQFLMLGTDGAGGSYALSKDQSDFFYDSLQAIAKNISDTINKYAIKQLIDLNWPGTKDYPSLCYDDIGSIDKQKFAETVNKLVGAQIITVDDKLEQYIRQELDLPDKPETDEDDDALEQMQTDLDLMGVDIAGAQIAAQPPEVQKTMTEEDIEDEMQFNEMIEDEILIFAAQGQAVSEDTKQKISQALKDYWAARGHGTDIEQVSTSQDNIVDAQRRIQELKTVINNFKSKASAIKDPKIKKAFNKSVKEKVDEIKSMIKAGQEGIKKEKASAAEAKKNIKQDTKQKSFELRKKRLGQRIEKDLTRIEKLDKEIDKTDSASKKQALRDRLESAKELLKERQERLKDLEDGGGSFSEKKKFKEQFEKFKGWRALTAAEKKVNFGNIQNEMDKKQAEFEKLLGQTLSEEKDGLFKKFEKAIAKKDYKAIQDIALAYNGKYKSEIFDKMKELYNLGKNSAASEMKINPPASAKEDMERLNAQATILTEDHNIKVMTKTKITVLDGMAKNETQAKIISRAETAFATAITELSQRTASIITGGSIGQGRRLTQNKNKSIIYAYQRSELLDNRVCSFCASIDGRVVSVDDPFAQEDIFHSNCRGMWVEIMKDEAELPEITGIPDGIDKTYEGVNDFKQLKTPIVDKKSLASEFIQEQYKKEITTRENKIKKYETAGTFPNRVEAHKTKIATMKKVLDKLK